MVCVVVCSGAYNCVGGVGVSALGVEETAPMRVEFPRGNGKPGTKTNKEEGTREWRDGQWVGGAGVQGGGLLCFVVVCV
jgi:hypothetical protein